MWIESKAKEQFKESTNFARSEVQRGRFRVQIGLYFQGILNYFGFFLLLSSAENISIHFGYNNWVSSFALLATVTGNTMILFNAYWLMKYKALPRIVCNTVIMAVGYAVISLGSYLNFFLALTGALIVGTASAFGDVTHLGYLGLFDP